MWGNSHPPLIEGPQGADCGPETVGGQRDNHQLFSLYFGRQTARTGRSQPGRKARVSRTPEIKMGVLLERSAAGKQALVTRAWVVVPFGLSLRGPNMSLDMRLFTVSDEAGGSDESESMAVGLSGPLG